MRSSSLSGITSSHEDSLTSLGLRNDLVVLVLMAAKYLPHKLLGGIKRAALRTAQTRHQRTVHVCK
eukprot:m.53808 g.53808  ORF g.53808 m.53808 type:complete len:66 (-) comp9167_c0_seq1:1067-1264(-)